jgi:hypothetical protein
MPRKSIALTQRQKDAQWQEALEGRINVSVNAAIRKLQRTKAVKEGNVVPLINVQKALMDMYWTGARREICRIQDEVYGKKSPMAARSTSTAS